MTFEGIQLNLPTCVAMATESDPRLLTFPKKSLAEGEDFPKSQEF